MNTLVNHHFKLSDQQRSKLQKQKPNFGGNGFGQMVYYRTYSRKMSDGKPEKWADTIIRVTEGTFSILKSHIHKHILNWDDEHWQEKANEFSEYMYNMCFLPPGRGLWAMGTDYVNERGSMALNNCAFVSTIDLHKAATWTMDALMCGCGVGFDTEWNGTLYKPLDETFTFVVPDSREGWVESMGMILKAYLKENQLRPVFDYSKIRKAGTQIKGFGGTSSGPSPLIKLHQRLYAYLNCYLSIQNDELSVKNAIRKMILDLEDVEDYQKLAGYAGLQIKNDKSVAEQYADYVCSIENKTYGKSRLIADIFNSIGACVVAGNVRRSAQIALGSIEDQEFIKLKDFMLNPERSSIMWMSNNTVRFTDTNQFSNNIKSVVNQLKSNYNGEPGIYNAVNVQRHGRVNKYHGKNIDWTREQETDKATGCNPCVTGDTLILTDKGLKFVKELVGKQFTAVMPSFKKNEDNKLINSTDKGFWSTGKQEVYKITYKDAIGTEHSIKSTADHKFAVNVSSRDYKCVYIWMEAKSLRIGSKLEGFNCLYNVSNIEKLEEPEEVFDCSIPDKNFYVANNILSHNCGEIALESYELCNLAEVFPTRCVDKDGKFSMEIYLKAVEYATMYASIVSLLPTHSSLTNQIIAKNHRIGVSLSGITLLLSQLNHTDLIDILKIGYRKVREINSQLAEQNGIPQSIRVTTVKPSGTISQLVGVPSGIHFPIAGRYIIRRVRSSTNDYITKFLISKNVPHETALNEDNTVVFEFPIDQGSNGNLSLDIRSTSDVTVWEQLKIAELMQHWWSDNSVSVTINYDPVNEIGILEEAISTSLPNVKSLSFLPKSNGVYKQAPYEEITKEKYEELIDKMPVINWDEYFDTYGQDNSMPRYCDGDSCLLSA